jgi:hypothetical protein
MAARERDIRHSTFDTVGQREHEREKTDHLTKKKTEI